MGAGNGVLDGVTQLGDCCGHLFEFLQRGIQVQQCSCHLPLALEFGIEELSFCLMRGISPCPPLNLTMFFWQRQCLCRLAATGEGSATNRRSSPRTLMQEYQDSASQVSRLRLRYVHTERIEGYMSKGAVVSNLLSGSW